jgi:hypothetical protein
MSEQLRWDSGPLADGAPQRLGRASAVQLKRELAGLPSPERGARVRPPAAPAAHSEPAGEAPVQMVTPEAPGDDVATKIAKYKGYLDSKGIAQSQQIAQLVHEALETRDNSKFTAAAALVPLDPLPAGRPLCLWSGHGCKEKAEATGVELNTTSVGKLASDWKFLGRSFPELFPLWCAVSARFVQSAKGEVHIFIGYSGYDHAGGIRANSVFGSTEKKALEDLAAAKPELRIVPKYHSVAAVHDLPTGTITGTAEGVPVSEDPAGVPEPKSLYWVTGNAGHVGHAIGCYIRPYDRDGQKVKGHLRGVS